ncbi:MAG: ABC transporter ATP-binding protein, partial [Kiritimatiellae bacterium]|nr:ABC transporter ATP-binding protein [Kiritimatiellia bacterium]
MSTNSTFSKILAFARPFRLQLLGMVALTSVLAAVCVMPPLIVRTVINRVIGEGETNLLPAVIVLYAAITLLSAGCGYLQTLAMAFVGQSFVMRVRTAVYDHLLGLSLSFFSRESTGKLVNRLMGDSGVLQQALTVTTLQVISDLICATFAISATLFINWRLAIPLYLLLFLFVLNYRLNIGRVRKLARAQRSAEDRVASGVQNRLAANLTVKTYGTEVREGLLFHEQSAASLDLAREGQVATSDFMRNSELLQSTGYAVIFFLGCAMVLDGTASYGDVTAFCSYTMLLISPAVRFSLLAQQLQNVKISAERLFERLDEEPVVTERPGAEEMHDCRGAIRFEDVHFGYVPDKEVLKGISLDVASGETVALVGTTGCGKTTILSLLMRLFDVTDGRITIDGHDIRDLTLKSLRSCFGIVLQESLLFSVSVADNIRYGKPQATQKQVEFAARIAEIHDEILALPRGYESRVGDHDVQLSVGQKQ